MSKTFFGNFEVDEATVVTEEATSTDGKGAEEAQGAEASANEEGAGAPDGEGGQETPKGEKQQQAGAETEETAESKDKVEHTPEELETLKNQQLEAIQAKDEKDRSDAEKEFLAEFGTSTDSYKDLIKSLAEESVLEVDEEKEYEGVDGFKQVVVDNIKSGIDAYKNKFDDETKKFLTFLENGGKREEYFEYLFEDKYSEVDETNEYNHKPLVEDLYKLQGYSPADIAEKIEMLEQNDKLAKEAAIAKATLSKMQENRDKAIQKKQMLEAKELREQEEAYQQQLEQTVQGLEDIADFKVTKKEKEELIAYISKPVKGGKTQYELDADKLENKIKLAFMQKKGFNFEKLERKATNKAASKLAESLNKIGAINYKNASKTTDQAVNNAQSKTQTPERPKLAWRFAN